MAARPPRQLIGLAEYVDLPDWRILRLRAKVDTGARSSALHVDNLREVARDRVRFDVRLHRRHPERTVTVEARVTRRARVRSTSGVSELRVFVETRIRVGSTTFLAELGLVDRQRMIYRMLLGRTALGARFYVDPSRRYLLESVQRPAAVSPLRRSAP